MIIFDDSIVSVFGDYGIMLPLAPSRARKIAESLGPAVRPPPAGQGIFPGPVLDIEAAAALAGKTGVPVTRSDVERVHSKRYADALYSDGLEDALLAAYELIDADGKPNRYEPEKAVKPLSALFDKILFQCAGSYLACALALSDAERFCYFLGGGNHHARFDSGAGFCLINEIIIAARKLQAEGDARLVWVIDVDAHKGCGSAELVSFMRSGRNPARFEAGCDILTLSAHMAHGWPLDDETLRNAVPGRAPLIPSDVEIPIEQGGEAGYLRSLEDGLRRLERLTPAGERPSLAIVVDGADPYEHDGLASSAPLRLSLKQCLERDMLIYDFLRERGIPSAWIMAGGYGERAWEPPARFLQALFHGASFQSTPLWLQIIR